MIENVRRHHKEILASITAIATLFALVFSGINFPGAVFGATYTFTQTAWNGGATGNTAVHPTNQTGWTQFSTSTNIVASSANLSLATTSASLSSRADVTQNWAGNAQNVAMAYATSTGVAHVVYLSYEYNPNVLNIAYRNSSNWSTRTDVTTYTSGSAIPSQTLSIAVDSSGNPHIAYYSYEYNATYLNIAYRNSSSWATRTDVTTNTNANSQSPSLVVDSSGVKHIAYLSKEYNPTPFNIAYRNSSNWATRTDVTTNTGANSYEPKLVVDSSGVKHIAYYSFEYNATYQNVAYRNSNNWATRTDVTTNTGAHSYSPSLAIGSGGTVHIVYYSKEYDSAWDNIAYRNSANWTTRTDITTSSSTHSRYPSTAIDSSDVLHVSYADYSGKLWYVNSSNWSSKTDLGVTNIGSWLQIPSIGVDSSGIKHIAYYSKEYNATYFNIAYRNSNNWATRTDITTVYAKDAINPAVAVDASSTIHIAYISKEYNPNYYNVAYRKSTDGGATWTARTDVTTASTNIIPAQSPSIALDSSGIAHIAYYSKEYDATYWNIAYRNSSSWVARTDITANTTRHSINPSLGVDSSDVKHIVYVSGEYSIGVYNIAYRNSSNWATRTDVTTYTTGGLSSDVQPSLAVDSSGVKHIAYRSNEYNASYYNIAYRNSSNWATRTDATTDTAGNIPIQTQPSLAVDSSGVKHIAYLSNEYNAPTIYYNIAYRNSNNWATRTDLTTDTTGKVPAQTPSIAVDSSGVAHVVYYSTEYSVQPNITYRSSSNWANRVDVTTNASITSYKPSISFSGGKTHIAYYSREFGAAVDNIAYKSYQSAGYQSSGNLVSSGYDTNDATNAIGEVAWDEDTSLPAGTTVTVSLRTASSSADLSSASWTNFTNGTTGCSKASGAVTCGASAIPSSMKDGSADKWFQYKVTLGGGTNTPTLSEVRIKYVVNAPPEFNSAFGTNGVTVSQNASSTDANWGKINVQYAVRDPDSTAGTATPGFITPSFEYNVGGGWVAIGSQYLGTGDTDNKGVDQVTYTTYSATWNAKTQIPGVYSATALVRVTANDNEAANNTTQATGASFVLDTKNPTSTLLINGVSSTITLTVSDDSNIEYRLSNSSDFSADGVNSISGQWQTVGTTSTSTSLTWTAGGTTQKIVYLNARDVYGNTATTTAVAPYAPTNFDLKDTSNVQNNEYSLFLSWAVYSPTSSATFVNYKLYRSTDGANYSPYQTITNSATNYYRDTGLSSSTTYYYKMATTDTDGDVSPYSTILSHMPSGQGGTDFTPPTISLVTVSTTQATWATITWTTDELSDSEVNYSPSSTAFNLTASSTSYVTSHSVTLTGLTPNTQYFLRVKSRDIFNNLAMADNSGAGYSFTTLGGPAISDVVTEQVTDNGATIVWNTNIDSNSYVVYSTNLNSLRIQSDVSTVGSASSVGGPPYQHRVSLTGLNSRTTYYYYVKSTDGNNNTATDTNGDNYYTFKTTYDTKAPVISNITTPVLTKNSAIIVWQTDEMATSQVDYGTTSGSYGLSSTLDSTLAGPYHNVTITGLTLKTKYYFQVKSSDAAGNAATSAENEFTTSDIDQVIISSAGGAAPAPQKDTTPPKISGIKATDVGSFNATIRFQTDKPSIGFVLYGRDLSYDRIEASPDFKTDHTIKLTGLKFGAKYDFKVKAQDQNANFATSENQSFTTKYAAEALEETVTLENAAQFQDKLEGIIESVLPSLVPPFIGRVDIGEVAENSATVTFRTNVASYGALAYAPDNLYDEKKDNPYTVELSGGDKKEREHTMDITGLSPSTLYHIQAKAFVIPGVIGKSKDITFITKASKIRPEIARLGNTDMEVRWITPEETSSFVEYKDLATGKLTKTGDDAKTKTHSITMENLTPNTPYEVKVFGYDNKNNIVEGDPVTVKTKQDLLPPVITNIRIDNALLPGRADRLQTVVSWRTDEPATSVVYFEEGVGISETLANSAGDKDGFTREYTTDHIVIVTTFKPSTVYRIQIASADESGNIAKSGIRSILTPRSAESVLDVITKNLQETFGFLKKLQQ